MLDFLNKLLGISEEEKKPAKAAAAVPAAKATVKPEDVGLTIPRLEIIQKMWGEGFSSPGNSEYVLGLAKPLTLDPQKSVLDISSGLGGFDRALSAAYKTYINGLERDKEIAAAGNAISQKTGFSRHAPIAHYDPEKFDYSKRVDAIIGREILYTVKNKGAFVLHLANALKPKGHLLLTDFTCDDADYINRPPVSLWVNSEPYGASLIAANDMVKLLEGQGFDVRINEDMTKPYSQQILQGLSRLTKFLDGKKLSPATREFLAKEVELWARRVSALDTAVKNTRFHAIKRS